MLKPSKDDTVGVRDWLVVPVFYATNREYSGADGSITYSDQPNNSSLLFGVKNVAVPAPNPEPSKLTPELLRQMSWQEVQSNEKEAGKAPSVTQNDCPLKGQLLSKSQVVSSFRSYTNTTGVHDSIIFVHGCCANFETSMKRAAKIAAHMRTPVLLYDWVSPVGFSKYLQNETRVQQTTDDFCRFLNNVEKVAEPSTITLLGHSMGAEFVDEAMVRRSIRGSVTPLKPFKEIIMTNADVDAKAFLKHAPEFCDNGPVRIYFSTNDDRLGASAVAHGGFARLGEPRHLLSELTKVKGAELVDITPCGMGHEIPFSVVAALHAKSTSLDNLGFKLEKREPGYFYLEKLP